MIKQPVTRESIISLLASFVKRETSTPETEKEKNRRLGSASKFLKAEKAHQDFQKPRVIKTSEPKARPDERSDVG